MALTSPRRGISYPDPLRTDAPDVPLYIGNVVAAVDVSMVYGHGTRAARPPSSGGSPGMEGRIYDATDISPHQLSYDEGNAWVDIPPVPMFSTRVLRPAANTVPTGTFYYAVDQVALYLSDGTNWLRIGDQPGDIVWTAESAARTGYLLMSGQAWPGTTGIYADLFAKWGGIYPSVLPDVVGRTFVSVGSHANIVSVGANEGLASGARRPIHKHTNVVTNPVVNPHNHDGGSHSHTLINPVSTGVGGVGSIDTSATAGGSAISTNPSGTIITSEAPGTTGTTVTVGPQTGLEPTDSGAYIVLRAQVKL